MAKRKAPTKKKFKERQFMRWMSWNVPEYDRPREYDSAMAKAFRGLSTRKSIDFLFRWRKK